MSILEAPNYALKIKVTKRYMSLASDSSFEESFVREHDEAFIEALDSGMGQGMA